jgi:hypothetical protein
MEAVLFILLVFLGIGIYFVQSEGHEKKIYQQVRNMGGQVIRIERKTFSTGPFFLVGKGRTVYRIEYKIGDSIREGWVKFGDLFGPDWRL